MVCNRASGGGGGGEAGPLGGVVAELGGGGGNAVFCVGCLVLAGFVKDLFRLRAPSVTSGSDISSGIPRFSASHFKIPAPTPVAALA